MMDTDISTLKLKLEQINRLCFELKNEAKEKDVKIKRLEKQLTYENEIKAHNTEIINRQAADLKQKDFDLEMANKTITSLQNNEDLDTKEIIIRALEEKIETLEGQLAAQTAPPPPTPPTTPRQANESGEHKTNETSAKKRRRVEFDKNQTSCNILGIKFRTQGAIFLVKWNNQVLEYHAEDIAKRFEEDTRAFMRRLEEVKSRQLKTIKKKNITYLIDLCTNELAK